MVSNLVGKKEEEIILDLRNKKGDVLKRREMRVLLIGKEVWSEGRGGWEV